MSRIGVGNVFVQNDESPFEKKEICPIRITSIFGFDESVVIATADRLIKDFNWKFHSTSALITVDSKVFSIILWNTKP